MNRIMPAPYLWLSLALVAAPLHAGGDDKARDQEAARAALLRHEILPIGRILVIARRAAPGEVIEVELKRRKAPDGPVRFKYEVKMLAATGRVREVEVDARTGAVLKVEDD